MKSRAGQAGLDLLRARQRGAAAGHQLLRLERGDVVQRLRPVLEVGVARVGGVELDQVAREQDPLGRNPGHGVALGVAAAELDQLDLELAEPDAHPALEGHGRPGQAFGDALDVLEQAREAADLAVLVELAALDHQVVGVAAGDDLLAALGRRQAEAPSTRTAW